VRRRRLLLLGTCAAVILAGLAALAAYGLGASEDDGAKAAKSGLRGVVLLVDCPFADSDSCVRNPVAATQRVRRASDEGLIEEFRSDSDGSFRVALRPGRYIIEGASGGFGGEIPGSVTPLYVTVPKSGYKYVRIVYQVPRD
jgi:hypothetical protein